MNKSRGKLLLLTLILIGVVAMPINVSAGKKKTCNKKYGIDITPNDYSRTSHFLNGGYVNVVKPRTVTISVDHPSMYEIHIYESDFGVISSTDHFVPELPKNSGITERVINKGDLRLKNEGDKKANNVITVEEGKEALIVALFKGGNDDDKFKEGSETKCETGISYDGCCLGEFVRSSPSDDIEGVASVEFVQNPKNSFLVDNLRSTNSAYGTACKNASDGVFQQVSDDPPEEEFTIENWINEDWAKELNLDYDTVLKKWNNEYLSKIFPYCNLPQVAYNLKENDIKKITNKLLRMFKYLTQLEKTGTSNIDDIKTIIDNYKKQFDDIGKGGENGNYYILDSGTGVGNPNVLSSSLQCDYKNVQYNEQEKTGEYAEGKGQEEYLYAETNSKSTSIKFIDNTTKNINVCTAACYEHLAVVYSPPQVVKAGLCFQYRVTIKSVTDCGAKIDDDVKNYLTSPPNSADENSLYPSMCSPTPICNGQEDIVSAGPSKEFDDCVKSCDGGKYSQKCINKCYNKIYGSTTKTKTNKTKSSASNTNNKVTKTSIDYIDLITKTTPSTLVDDNNHKGTIKKLDDASEFTDKQLENYYKEGNSSIPAKCRTNQKISENIKYCASYFFTAKTLKPMVSYDCGKNSQCTITVDSAVSEVKSKADSTIEFIGRQIARASSFYVRDEKSTEETIEGLFNANKSNSAQRKYYIDANGIKVQASKKTGWVCPMKCTYHGCDDKDATSGKEYIDNMNDNLKNINEALRDCRKLAGGSGTAKEFACDTNGRTTTEFEIKVTAKRKAKTESQKSTGTTNLNVTTNDTVTSNCPDGKNKPSMFIPAFKNDNSSNGIFGTCYDDDLTTDGTGKRIDYQTTITFPGSWIDLKTGEVHYDCQNTETHREKTQYYCTPYDAQDVHTKWWEWAVHDNYDSNKYPDSFNPDVDDWNITAELGKESREFGKYGWNIGFKCFYSLKNTSCTDCDDTPCYRGDDGTEENCPDPDDPDKEIEKEEKTTLNYDIRVVSLESVFPKDRLRGFNWGSAAQLKAPNDPQVAAQLKAGGYDIDPVDYSHEIMGGKYNGLGEDGTYKDSNLDFSISLDAKDIQNLKSKSLEFGGSYITDKEIIPGLYAYDMFGNSNLSDIASKINKNKFSENRGKNNIK